MGNTTGNGTRIALVIGNAAYTHAGKLANPANDAKGMFDALEGLGFAVSTGIDLARDPMENAFFDFETAIRDAEVALLFYAGHGLQVKGENYLIPADANIEMEMHLKRRAFSLSEVLGVMSKRARTNLIFLDACRNNPFTRLLSRTLGLEGERALLRGLAEARAARGIFIAFATSPNEVALDGKGKNSPFTAAILKHIRTPGLSITDMMTDVINEVAETTGDKQQPWQQSNLRAKFYFNPVETTVAIGSEPAIAVSGLAQIIGTSDGSTLLSMREDFSGTSEVAHKDIAELEEAAHIKAGKATTEPKLAEPAVVGVVTSGDPLTVQHDSADSRLETLDEIKVSFLKAGREVYFSLKPGETFRDLEIFGPEMVVVPPGEFMMGSRGGEGNDDEHPQHKVTIPRALAVGKYPVTCAEWDAAVALGGVGPPRFLGRGGQLAVRGVSWDDAKEYLRWLSEKSGQLYRLLSEAEWEYACRAGTTTTYSFGDQIPTKKARFLGLDWDWPLDPGSFPLNPFGLGGMHGNIWEWCEDRWHRSYENKPLDLSDTGSAWTAGNSDNRILRGAGHTLRDFRSAARSASSPGDRSEPIGFRVARSLDP